MRERRTRLDSQPDLVRCRATSRTAVPGPISRAKAGFQYGASKAALNRLTIAAASECEGQGIAVNALTPQAAIATPSLMVTSGAPLTPTMFEPLDTMAEAALALCSRRPCGPHRDASRSACSSWLELKRPVLDLHGEAPGRGMAAGRPGRHHHQRRKQNLAGREAGPTLIPLAAVHSPRPS